MNAATSRPAWGPCLTAGLLLGAATLAWADPLAGADLQQGEQLIADKKCTECHQRKVGGDGIRIYRPGERVQSRADLIAMVQRCDSELGLGLFPDEVAAIAAVLNRDHYRFVPAPMPK